jgi:hypothetical protein
LSTIQSIETQYDTFRFAFKFPNQLDFMYQDVTVTVDVPATLLNGDIVLNDFQMAPASHQLAHTQNNVPLHLYTETLSRHLVALDAVETGLTRFGINDVL